MPLIYLSCAWVAGILLGAVFHPHPALGFLAAAPLPLVPLFRKYWKLAVLSALCLVAVFGGTMRYQSVRTEGLRSYNGSEVELRGVVDSDPDVRDRTTQLAVKVTALKSGTDWQTADASVLLFVPRYPAYAYGDSLLVRGRLETPRSEGFDYRGYLANRSIYSVMRYPRVEVLEQGGGSRLLATVYAVRNRLSEALSRVLPEPQAALAQGIVLGKRGNIPSWLNDDFSRTGTTHLLAISGVNISIVAGILLSVGIWLWGRRRYLYVWLALVAVWLYALLTGMNPPVFRSAIMATLFLLAEALGRQRQAFHALCLAAAVMTAVNPLTLWDVSFQLSFLAMAGLVFLTPSFQTWARRAFLPETGAAAPVAGVVTDSLAVTLGAIIFVSPLIAYYFGIVSLAGPVATLLATPALAPIIITGVLAGALGLVFPPAGIAAGWLAWLFLSWFLLVVRVFAAVPSGSVGATVSPVLLWVYYVALCLLVSPVSRRRIVSALPALTAAGKQAMDAAVSHRRWLIPCLLVVAALSSFIAISMPDANLHISFLDVGQGDSTLVQTPARQNILIDGGPSPQALELALGQKLPFWDRTIDLMVLTHPHADHLAGLVDVLGRYRVKQVLYPESPGDSPLYAEFQRLVTEKDIKSTPARAGQEVRLGEGVIVEVLAPAEASRYAGDPDNDGVVVRLSAGRITFLLTADIKAEAELDLVTSRARLASTVLKVAHHGSDTSSSAGFLAVVSPRLAVVSVGKDNRFGHPGREAVGRLRQAAGDIYRTDEHGTLEFITDGERLWMKRERG